MRKSLLTVSLLALSLGVSNFARAEQEVKQDSKVEEQKLKCSKLNVPVGVKSFLLKEKRSGTDYISNNFIMELSAVNNIVATLKVDIDNSALGMKMFLDSVLIGQIKILPKGPSIELNVLDCNAQSVAQIKSSLLDLYKGGSIKIGDKEFNYKKEGFFDTRFKIFDQQIVLQAIMSRKGPSLTDEWKIDFKTEDTSSLEVLALMAAAKTLLDHESF